VLGLTKKVYYSCSTQRKVSVFSFFVMSPAPLILIDTGIIGGPGRGIVQLGRFLESKSIRYLICNFKYPRPKSREFEEELQRQGLRAATVSQRFVFDSAPILQFYRLAREGRYNILQSHGYKSHVVALVVSRITGLPWLAFTHGWTREDRKVAIYHALDKWMLRIADSVIAVSPPLFNLFREVRGERRQTHLIFNAADTSTLPGKYGGEAVRRRLLAPGREVLVGCFGRLSFEKGVDILLRSISLIRRGFPQVSFLILGDGPEREALGSLATELGLGDSVTFEPHALAMRDYYEAIDLLVLPSRSEGLPNVVLEALSFGVRVVGTDVGAVREVITDRQNGWVAPSGDPRALARVMDTALSWMMTQGREPVAKRELLGATFTPEYRSLRIMGVYQNLLEGRT